MSRAKAPPSVPVPHQYTREHREKSGKLNEYFVALPVQKKTVSAYAKITGAERAWKSEDKADWVYIPAPLRIAGTPANIRKVLRFWHTSGEKNGAPWTNEAIDSLLNDETDYPVFSLENTRKGKKHHAAYLEAVAEKEAEQKTATASYRDLAPSTMAIQTYSALLGKKQGKFYSSMEAAREASKKESLRVVKEAPKTRQERLAAALSDAAQDDKVIDLSAVDEDFIGYKTTKKHNGKNLYYLADDYPQMDSKNREGYERGLKAMGLSGAEFKAALKAVDKVVAAAEAEAGEEDIPVPSVSRKGSPRSGSRSPASRRSKVEKEEEEEEEEAEEASSPKPKAGRKVGARR